MDVGKGSPDSPKAEKEPAQGEKQIDNGPEVDDKTTKAMIWGLAILVVGVALAAIMPLSFAHSAANAEYSYETVAVGANEEVVLEVKTREGRYDWFITSDSYFDGYLIASEYFPAHLAGQEFPQVGRVENVRSWKPFLQTGGGTKHGLVLVNPGDRELTARVQTMFRRNPPLHVFFLLPLGLLVALGGLIVTIIGLARKTRLAVSRRSSLPTSPVVKPMSDQDLASKAKASGSLLLSASLGALGAGAGWLIGIGVGESILELLLGFVIALLLLGFLFQGANISIRRLIEAMIGISVGLVVELLHVGPLAALIIGAVLGAGVIPAAKRIQVYLSQQY